MALHCWAQLRLVRDTRDEALHLLVPWTGDDRTPDRIPDRIPDRLTHRLTHRIPTRTQAADGELSLGLSGSLTLTASQISIGGHPPLQIRLEHLRHRRLWR